MGRRIPRVPPTEAQYVAGLKEGRDIYQEDLDGFVRRARQVQIAMFVLAVFVGLVVGTIVMMLK